MTTADEVLYDRPATEEASGRDCQLRIVARWSPRQDVLWAADVDDRDSPAPFYVDLLTFRLGAPGAYYSRQVTGHVTRRNEASAAGWIDSGKMVGDTATPAQVASVRWVNLADIGAGALLKCFLGVVAWPGC